MAETYRLSAGRKVGNALVTTMVRLGLPVGTTYLLTVRGRRTGRPRTTPVTLVVEGGRRWLVAPYGSVNWVRNARAAGEVTLARGRHTESVRLEELGPEESAPVLKMYLNRVPIVRPYFDITPEASLEAFAAEAPRHPVFRIVGGALA